METGSYVLVGVPDGAQSFFSTAHGSGRTMSRTQAKRQWRGGALQRELADRGIVVRTASFAGLAEEAGGAYKDIDDAVTAGEAEELERREALYRGTRPPPRIAGRVVILVDDGLATGATMRAAAAAVATQQPVRLVVAVPTAAPDTCEEFRQDVDDVICLEREASEHALPAVHLSCRVRTTHAVDARHSLVHRLHEAEREGHRRRVACNSYRSAPPPRAPGHVGLGR